MILTADPINGVINELKAAMARTEPLALVESVCIDGKDGGIIYIFICMPLSADDCGFSFRRNHALTHRRIRLR